MASAPIHLSIRQVFRQQGLTFTCGAPIMDQVRDLQQYKEECWDKFSSGEYNTTVGFLAREANNLYYVTRQKSVLLRGNIVIRVNAR